MRKINGRSRNKATLGVFPMSETQRAARATYIRCITGPEVRGRNIVSCRYFVTWCDTASHPKKKLVYMVRYRFVPKKIIKALKKKTMHEKKIIVDPTDI